MFHILLTFLFRFKNAVIEITAIGPGMFEVTGRVLGVAMDKVELVFQVCMCIWMGWMDGQTNGWTDCLTEDGWMDELSMFNTCMVFVAGLVTLFVEYIYTHLNLHNQLYA